MTVLSPSPIQHFEINNQPAVGAFLFTYLAGTTTKAPVYTDATGGESFTNPVVMNARGEPENTGGASTGVWLPIGVAYKFVFAPSTDTDPPTNPIWTVDNIISPIVGADVVLTFTGGPPTMTQWLGGESIRQAISFPANFAGSGGTIPKTLPTGAFVVAIKKNGVQVGSASCSTGGVWTFTSSGAVSFGIGDELDFYGPGSADASMANFGLTLAGALG